MKKNAQTWTIEIRRRDDSVERCTVPLHRLENRKAAELLRILVARYEELEFKKAVSAFLNDRKGGPSRDFIKDAKYFIQPERALAGYYLFGPTIYAQASHQISQEACDFVLKNRSSAAA